MGVQKGPEVATFLLTVIKRLNESFWSISGSRRAYRDGGPCRKSKTTPRNKAAGAPLSFYLLRFPARLCRHCRMGSPFSLSRQVKISARLAVNHLALRSSLLPFACLQLV
jgi:hypothetical protein